MLADLEGSDMSYYPKNRRRRNMYPTVGTAFEQDNRQHTARAAEFHELYTAALLLSFRLHNSMSHPAGIREKWGQLKQAIERIGFAGEMEPESVALAAVAVEVTSCDRQEELYFLAGKLQDASLAASPLFEAA